jgi:hypothetical protein
VHYLRNKVGQSPDTGTWGLTGLRQSNQVTVTLKQGLGVTTTWTGLVEGDVLRLQVPTATGVIQEFEMTPGDASIFNLAVMEATQQFQSVTEEQQRLADDAALREQLVAADAAYTEALQAVEAATVKQSEIEFSSELADVEQAAIETNEALNEVRVANAEAVTLYDCSTVEYLASTVDYRVVGVEYATRAVESSIDSALNTIKKVITTITAAETALATLEGLRAEHSSVDFQPTHSQADLDVLRQPASSVIDETNMAIDNARTTAARQTEVATAAAKAAHEVSSSCTPTDS